MYFFDKRTELLRKIKLSIDAAMKPGKIVDENKLISACIEDYDVSWNYVLQLLEELEHDKIIVREYGFIWTPLGYNIDKGTDFYHKVIQTNAGGFKQ